MLRRIESFIITSEDFDGALAFFKDKLKLAMPAKSEDMARFELESIPIFVARSDKGGGSFISIETDDIEGDYKQLKERGVDFFEPINTMQGGDKVAFFRGPADTEFMLYQPASDEKS